MKVSTVFWSLSGAAAVYGAVAMTAARSASPRDDGSVLTRVFFPVPAAMAHGRDSRLLYGEATQTLEFNESCSHVLGAGPKAQRYAEHVFPSGRKAVTLGRVHVLGHYAEPAGELPEGYTHVVVSSGVLVRDGSIAVMCGRDGDAKRFDSVIMILPKAYKLELDTGNPFDDTPPPPLPPPRVAAAR